MKINEMIQDAKKICISGHIRPDGDCVGSCLGLYGYLHKHFPDREVEVRLEALPEKYNYLDHADQVLCEPEKDCVYDLFFSLDAGDKERLGQNEVLFDQAKRTINIDHHVSNTRFAMVNIVEAQASSTCEVLCDLMDLDQIPDDAAQALYTGIVTDTGVFRYSSVSRHTMELAGALMEHSIDAPGIIRKAYFERTYAQSQIIGKALLESMLFLNGTCVASDVSAREMRIFGVTSQDMDGIIDQLMLVSTVECGIFLYEIATVEYRVSLRSRNQVDVSKVAKFFGGGGHARAAGCTIVGTAHDVINNVVSQIAKQMEESV